jgi:hypothetical protein
VVAVAVVDQLEMIDVDHQARQRLARAASAPPCHRRHVQRAAIEQAGQRIQARAVFVAR